MVQSLPVREDGALPWPALEDHTMELFPSDRHRDSPTVIGAYARLAILRVVAAAWS